MALTRPDSRASIKFNRVDGQWTTFEIEWWEELTDGTEIWTQRRINTYAIADLDTDTKQALQDAWDGMKGHRDTVDPL